MRKKQAKGHSVFISVLLPMLAMALLNMAVIFLLMDANGVFTTLKDNALDLLMEHTQSKQLPLQQQMTGRWGALDNFANAVVNTLEQELGSRGASVEDMQEDAALNAALVEACAPEMLSCIRASGATGVFIVLNGRGVKDRPGTYAGVYFRDTDPANVAKDGADVLMERGLPPVSRNLGISLDVFWQASFDFNTDESEFFFRPIEAARAGSTLEARDYGCWCGPLQLSGNDTISVVTYSMPLIGSDGSLLGVIGAEVTTNYLASVIASGENNRSNPNSYMLARTFDGTHYLPVTTVGQTYRQDFGAQRETVLTLEQWERDGLVAQTSGSRSGSTVYSAVYPLKLYNHNTPFEDETWVLIGLESADNVLSFNAEFMRLILYATLSALVLGSLLALMTGLGVTQKITNLARQIRVHPDDQELELSPTGLREIDILSEEIMRQNRQAMGQNQRLSSMLSLTGTAVGMYEIRDDDRPSYCSRGIYRLCGLEVPADTNLTADACRQLLDQMLTEEVDVGVFRVQTENGPRYLRHKKVELGVSTIGTLLDVTVEMENRYRVEHERDFDVLTNLLNRRALGRLAEEWFEQEPEKLKTAVVMMLDLDNLKYINDTYGHDWGDAYLCCFADALRENFGGEQCLVGRRSGDEFFVIMYGWNSREELQAEIRRRWEKMREATILLPDKRNYHVHASGGLAWYPDDDCSFEMLWRFADFAMYKVKHDKKGMLESFDRNIYNVDSILMSGRDALRRMLDDSLVKYVYQPIVSAEDGRVMAYELLMRPQVVELSTPLAALRVAKEHGMLHHVERLTWFSALAAARSMREKGLLSPECRLFINSLANQRMSDQDEKRLLEAYGDMFPYTVMELTEGENNNQNYTQHKIDAVRKLGGEIAIDDFGTGYNSEVALMRIDCDYVKLDISFVRNVDSNRDQQAMAKGLIYYARNRNIRVLSEGVETAGELKTLLSFGVDYFQGYFIGRPQDEPQQPSEASVAVIRAYQAEK